MSNSNKGNADTFQFPQLIKNNLNGLIFTSHEPAKCSLNRTNLRLIRICPIVHPNNLWLCNLKQLIKCIKNNNTQFLIISQLVFDYIITELLKRRPIRNLFRHNTIDSIMTIFLANVESNIALIASQLLTNFLDNSGLADTAFANQTNVICQRINANLTLLTKLSCHYTSLLSIKTSHLHQRRHPSFRPHRTAAHRPY